MATFQLPDRPYDPGALGPHISGRVMGPSHGTYVQGSNTARHKLDEARAKGDVATMSMLERNLAFNVPGHVLHSVFWTNLSPDGGDKPTGPLATATSTGFGSFDAFAQADDGGGDDHPELRLGGSPLASRSLAA